MPTEYAEKLEKIKDILGFEREMEILSINENYERYGFEASGNARTIVENIDHHLYAVMRRLMMLDELKREHFIK